MDKDLLDKLKHHCAVNKDKVGAYGVWRATLEDVNTGKKEIKYFYNVVPLTGLGMVCNNFADPTPDNAMLLTHCLLGSNATVVTENDTTLGTEVYRNTIQSKTSAANILYGTGFFSQTETDGTYKEAGIVSDGSAGADTGILVSHVNIDITKTAVQKLTLDFVITFTPV